MDIKDIEFLKRLKDTFRTEAEEHIHAISAGLIELEKAGTEERKAGLLEAIFREAHSFKGAARSVSLKDIESICQAMEGVFSALRTGSIQASPDLFDLLHRGVDIITRIGSSTEMEGSAADSGAAREVSADLGRASAGSPPPQSPAREARKPRPKTDEAVANEAVANASMVRIPMERLDTLLRQAEEMVAIKMTAGERLAELLAIDRSVRDLRAGQAYRGEARMEELESRIAGLVQALEGDERSIRRMVDEHLEGMKRAAMLPLSFLVESFPKLVRDLARDQGKKAELTVSGEAIELDKRILEEMKDPFIHILRNCLDHGIRRPEERTALGKDPQGSITIAFHAKDGREVEMLVSDDGEGIALDRVKSAAIKSGLLSREAAEGLGREEALALVFRSGISTSPIVTDISGRGLGMAIVREKVEKLGGSVAVASSTPTGTVLRILLPLTLSTYRGVVVRVGESLFILPAASVERVLRIGRHEIMTVEGRQALQTEGRSIALVNLADVLGLRAAEGQAGSPGLIYIVIVASSDNRIAFRVDEIIGEQQVMIKGLGRQLRRVRNIAGAAMLGKGKVVPVLNASDLVKSAPGAAAEAWAAVAAKTVEAAEAGTKAGKIPSRPTHILIADDSITARSLLKNILEGSGYLVTTAVDGAEAFAKAHEGEFDLVVSDVDMPRMSGFELTSRIRKDARLSRLPVVLVTALESREDKERGIDAGADAYIVKSSFDQGNLLDVIRRFI